MLVVYHGATCAVSQPLCHVGRANLDLLSQSLASECLRYVGTEALTDRELQKGN